MEKVKCEQVAQLTDNRFNEMTGRVYDTDGLSPTIRTFGGGNSEVKSSRMEYHRGTVQKGKSQTITTSCNVGVLEPIAYDEQNDIIRKDGTIGTLTTDGSSPKHNNRIIEECRVRKLTPRECGRLMGVRDEDITIMAKNQSDSSLYHLFGDSIVVDVLMAIFKEML